MRAFRESNIVLFWTNDRISNQRPIAPQKPLQNIASDADNTTYVHNTKIACLSGMQNQAQLTPDLMPQPGASQTQFGALTAEQLLQVQAELLGRKRFGEAATALAQQLANRLKCDRVSLGWRGKSGMTVVAASYVAEVHARQETARLVAAVMDEAAEQGVSLIHPEPDTARPHILLAHDELALAQQEGRLQRNFQGYSLLLADDLLGLGVSAISQMGDFYLQNERELGAYYACLDQGQHPVSRGFRVSQEDKLRRYIIMSLICELRLDMGECGRRFGMDFAAVFNKELLSLRTMEVDGLLQISVEEIQVSHRGRPFLRNICMLFDAYIDSHDGNLAPSKLSPII